MSGSGKRSRQDNNDEGRYQKRRHFNNDGERVVYRLLCPSSVIEGVIGNAGEEISMLQHETRARIKVLDPFPGTDKRVITIYCYVKEKHPVKVSVDGERPPLCPAQDALLRLHSTIVSAVANSTNEALLLVPASQAARVIGKGGEFIKSIRRKTGANIEMMLKNPGDPSHSCAMSFDNFAQITGDSEAVKNALYAVSAIMYKYSPEEEISLDPPIPRRIPTGSFYSGAGAMPFYGNLPPVPIYTAPAGSLYFSAGAMPLSSQSGDNHYNSFYSSSLNGYGGLPQYTADMPIPANAAGKVIGIGGHNIDYIQKITGARLAIVKSKTSETIVRIYGTAEQNRAAQNCIQAIVMSPYWVGPPRR